ncbi:hypothetical protein [Halovulum marinum]|uniref:hypothetical protein n=1 Tax=Halovulum marinum TaxID=2662447 RepID=UPI0012B2607D|nr:hypothetical protein [Halovulum marinum]
MLVLAGVPTSAGLVLSGERMPHSTAELPAADPVLTRLFAPDDIGGGPLMIG